LLLTGPFGTIGDKQNGRDFALPSPAVFAGWFRKDAMARPGEQSENVMDPAGWLDRHGDSLYRFAISRLRDPEAAEEVVQETFVAALHARDQYRGQGTEGAWLLGICKRKVVDHIRRRSRPDAATGGDLGPDPSEAMFDTKGNWRLDPRIVRGRPESALEREEFWKTFRECLRRLSQRQADAFTLRELDDLGSEEICKELAISASNLWVLLHRARLGLTRCMKLHLEN
jgi:RNA polymerase sigma-70 factor (ECF subfamily)